ncbi:sulfotransferase family protein [Nonomuraea sp. NN258]|uniref:sulfotransferase family protein n=1 Tax=Nonomuraea antri TaxID=2730852 RepID=UPI001568EADA|nr:sulfotransferase [Nonomuraea antri]NRQ33205.1 sulfotransferase family protein [Nonomuraea antri]
MLQVIGAGFPRTGTTSMKAALERLGFGPCYHMFEILTQPEHVDRWLPTASGGPVDWNEVFAGYRSSQDWPASHFWRQQAEAFPEAKIVLTVRDPHRWYLSMQKLLASGPAMRQPADDRPPAATALLDAFGRLAPVLDLIGNETFETGWEYGQGVPEEKVALAAFERHVAEVKESAPADRLLVFDVREGWEPLCRFLGVDVPDEPFPHLNEAETMQRMLSRMMTEGVVESPFDTRG